MIQHRAVVNYCWKNRNNVMGLIISDDMRRIVSITTISFDIFVTESLLPLVNGMTVIIADEAEQNQQHKLSALIRKHQVEGPADNPVKNEAAHD